MFKNILLASVGALFLSIILFLGFKSFRHSAYLPEEIFLASVSDSGELESGPGLVGHVDSQPTEERRLEPTDFQSEAGEQKLCGFATIAAPKRGPVIFNEVAWMGSVSDSSHEWIELKNNSSENVDISGWQIFDQKEQISVIFEKNTILVPKGLYLLEKLEEAVEDKKAHKIYSGILANSGEGLRLFNSECVLIDEVLAEPKWPAGDAKEKRTMERGASLGWHTYSGSGQNGVFGTPLKENSLPKEKEPDEEKAVSAPEPQESSAGSAQTSTEQSQDSEVQEDGKPEYVAGSAKLVVSEVMAGSELSSSDEFVELYNYGDEDVDLTGFFIKKKSSTGSESTLVSSSRLAGKTIKAKQYFLLANEEGYSFTTPADVFWPKSYTLAQTNNSVVLFDATSEVIHEVFWPKLEKGQSYTCSESKQCFTKDAPEPQNSQ